MSEAGMVEAVDECVRWRGGVAGDYRPSLSSLRVIRLLGRSVTYGAKPGSVRDNLDVDLDLWR
jgi:hypothetical protein